MKQELIESALKLNGKSIDDISVKSYIGDTPEGYARFESVLSMEKFCYYLLSPDFIENYGEERNQNYLDYYDKVECLARAIYNFQKGYDQPLISLLEEIG